MNISFDYTYGVAAASGIGRYANRLARAFPEVAAENDSFSLFFADFLRSFSGASSCPECQNDSRFSFSPARMLPVRVYERLWNVPGMRSMFSIVPGKADLCHITSHAAIPVPKRQKMVCTIHDMAAWRFPEGCAMAKDRKAIYANAQRADAIITDSRFSAEDIRLFLPEFADKVVVIHLGIDHNMYRSASQETVDAMRKTLHLERPYLLTVGLIHPTKNHVFLGKVLDSLGKTDLELVISGAPSLCYETIEKEIRSLRCAERVRLIGRIDDKWLPALYSGAEIYVTASRSEGFGFTPLEAMSCGTPVVSSAAGSLPEVLGDAACIIADNSIDHWRDEVLRLLHDSRFRAERSKTGRSWALRYTWKETAVKTLGVYRRILSRD